MQKKKQPSRTKQIIIFIAIVTIVLLIVFAEDIIKLANKNKIALQENNPNETTATEPNPPHFVAGMIPVKWDGEKWIITTREDKDWYDYKTGTPAYVMLNDGYYRSEIERGVEPDQLMENNIGVGVPDDPSVRGTIFVWIPRFAYNETGDIQYIKDVEAANENWTIPDIFTHKQELETAPDFLLTGIWFEIDVDTNYLSKINIMNTKDSIYGFIANTKALASDQTTGNTIKQYIANVVGATRSRNTQENLPNVAQTTEEYPSNIEDKELLDLQTNDNTNTNVGAFIARPQIADITNPNRVILHIVNQRNQDPIKVKAYYDKETGLIKIEVTYTKNGIAKILDEDGNTLSENSKTADTGDKILEKTEYTFTVIDKAGNKKKLNITGMIPNIYGKEITNYDCPVEGIKWRIFHKDDSNIYLIADDYIPYSSIPTSTKENALNKSSDYIAYFTNTLNDYTGSEWILNNTNANAQKWLNKYLTAYPNSTNNNIKAVAYMMDTDSWSKFAGDKAEYAIGGATIELFCASYKVTHPDKYIECDSVKNNGYQVKLNDGVYSKLVQSLTKDDFEEIYIKSNNTKARGMWLSSPSSGFSDSVIYSMCDGSVGSNYFYNTQYFGFRPIVCLKSGIELQNNGDGTYRLQSPIEATAYYDKAEGKIKIEVTYTKNGISKILDEDGNALSENSTKADTGDKEIAGGIYSFTVVDNAGNKQELQVNIPIYAALYTDGTLAFGTTENPIPQKDIIEAYDISGKEYNSTMPSWYDNRNDITTVNIVNKISPISTMRWFSDCTNLTTIENISNLDTSKVTNMLQMFCNCSSLTVLDVSNFDTSNVTSMSAMFRECSKLTELDVSNFDTSKVTDMLQMFCNCSSLTELDVSNFKTSNVTNMDTMFRECSNLTKLDLSNFDTSNVISMAYMFLKCNSLTELDLSNFDTSSVTDMADMFNGCSGLTKLDVTSFDTSNVTNMKQMFVNCNSLRELDVSSFDTSKATDMKQMFGNCTNLNTIYVNQSTTMWSNNIKNSTSSSSKYYGIFAGCGTSIVTRK